ncbi:MAG: LEA type 2 family protein [Nitrospirae bacterium]|nr:LEA type 2 family protein [Candidatus Manganitrophaceae bacterium]
MVKNQLLLLSFLILLFGCTPARIIAKPEWRLQGIQVDRIDLSGASLGLAVQMTNPNPFGITVQHLSYQVFLHEVEVAAGEKTDAFELPRHGSAEILFPVEVRLKKARELAPFLRKAPEEIDYRIEGEVTLRAMGMEKRFPLHHVHEAK